MWTENDYLDDLFDSLSSMLQEQDAAYEANNRPAFYRTVKPIGDTMASLLKASYTMEEIAAAVDLRQNEE